MTINEVEHAIRGLIVSQPMITAGPVGSTITGVLHTIETFKNFKLSIQSYPVQDSFKFINTTECQRLENTLCVSVCQVMQEKGLNIMGFIPSDPSLSLSNPYGSQPIPPAQNPSMMGQMPYNTQPQYGAGQNQYGAQTNNNWQYQAQYNNPVGGQSPQFGMQQGMQHNPNIQPNMMNSMPKQPINNQQMFQKMNQPPFSGNQNPSFNEQWQNNASPKSTPSFNQFTSPSKPASLSGVDFNTPAGRPKKLSDVEMMQPMANTSRPITSQKPKLNAFQAQAAESNEMAEAMENGTDEAPSSKAAGRDYLLKLLKTR